MIPMRWQRCISHTHAEIDPFMSSYFGSGNRRVLLIAGGGFDPRATSIAKLLSKYCRPLADGIFIKEERPGPDPELVARAARNLQELKPCVAKTIVIEVDVFAPDGAVVGGRTLLQKLELLQLDEYTDIVIDVSALSIGISFPLVRYALVFADTQNINLHLFVCDLPALDHSIVPQLADRATVVHGFRRVNAYYSDLPGAKLWLPQLAPGANQALQRIFDEVQPNDTCPIVPFPARDPKLVDRLFAEYMLEIENAWSVDSDSFIYADESDPLGLYRSIIRLNDELQQAFQALRGSLLIISPTGSKLMAIGALMAALDRDLPVYYIESRAYEITWSSSKPIENSNASVRHVWLAGDAYRMKTAHENMPTSPSLPGPS
jgi:hypothetical protein